MARHPGTPVGDLFPPGVAIFGAGGGQGQQALPPASFLRTLLRSVRLHDPLGVHPINGHISRDTVILSLRYPISRDTF